MGAEASATDGVEGPGETTDHAVEVAAAFGGHGEVASFLKEVEAVNGFDGVGVAVFAMGCAKGGKVMGADQVLGGCLHGGEVEGDIAAGPKVALLEGVGAPEVEMVAVAFAFGGMAGVKGVGYFFSGTYLNGIGED